MKTKLFRRIPRISLFLLFIIISLLLITIPERYIEECRTGISLWAVCVLPATFPFLFITALLTRLGYVNKLSSLLAPLTKRLFRLSGVSGYVLVMSMISGYPVGAKILCDLREGDLLSPAEAEKMSVIASTSGPLFIIGSVGNNMFRSFKAGVFILLAHFLATVLTGVFFRGVPCPSGFDRLRPPKREDDVLYASMYSSVLSVLCVGGFIVVFYVLSCMTSDLRVLAPFAFLLEKIPPFQGLGDAFCLGLIEMTGGCKALSASPSAYSAALCAFLITLGGCSILMQQIAYFKKARIKIRLFILAKLIQAALSFVFCLALCLIFGF